MLPDARRKVLERWHLDGWLVEATRGLAQESYERVREEIADHFHEALDAGIDSGLEPSAAAEAAVESLGPPRKARREFRRTYLTTSQMNVVRSFAGLPKPDSPAWARGRLRRAGWGTHRSRLRLAIALTAITFAGVALSPDVDGSRTFGLLCVALMVVGTSTHYFVPGVFRRGQERRAIVMGALAEAAVWGGYLLAFGQGRGPQNWLLAIFLGVLVVTIVPLLPKLQGRPAAE